MQFRIQLDPESSDWIQIFLSYVWAQFSTSHYYQQMFVEDMTDLLTL